MAHRLSRDEARRAVVRAQLLDAERPGDVVEVAEQLGEIKIDPTATIAACEQSVLFARIGPGYEPGHLADAVGRDRVLFEHLGTFRPVSMLPLMRPEMMLAALRESARTWLDANDAFRRDILARLRAEGPLVAAEIPDTAEVRRAPDGWSGANQVPTMLELLSRIGEVAVASRRGRTRVWDLAERVHPADLPVLEPAEATAQLQARRLQAAGIAKRRSPWTPVGEAGEPVEIEGLSYRYRIDPQALDALADDPGGRVAFLNPYDGMLFDRPRLRELFDFDFVLEQFKPAAERRYGYFAHPILIGDRFAGLLDAAIDKRDRVLRVAAVHELEPFEPEEHELVRLELQALGEWLGMPVVEGDGER